MIRAAVWTGEECTVEDVSDARRGELEEDGYALWPVSIVRDAAVPRARTGQAWVFSKTHPRPGEVLTAMLRLVPDWHNTDRWHLGHPEPPL
jgi:hypothetical protein